jgi:hypothetical protein
MLRKFFYVSASIFLLLATRPLVGQAGTLAQSQIVALLMGWSSSCATAFAVTVGGAVYRSDNGLQSGGFNFASNVFEGGPVTSPVVSATFLPTSAFLVVGTANGDIYWNEQPDLLPGNWHIKGNVFQGQPGSNSLRSIGFCPWTNTPLMAVAANGDVFLATDGNGFSWTRIDNVFSGSPTQVGKQAWGSLKVRYR